MEKVDSVTTMYVITGLLGGGAERLLANVILKQQELGETACVVVLTPGGTYRAKLEEAGIDVVDLGMVRHRDALRGAFRLASIIRRRRPVALQGWMYHANLLAWCARLLSGRLRTPLFWGIFCSNMDGRYYHWSFRLVLGLSRRLSHFVDGIVYNAEAARDFHHQIGFSESRSVVISNCVDASVFRYEPAERSKVRAELGIAEEDIMIVVVARVDPMKDWSTVMEAVRDLPGTVTVAVGNDTDKLAPQDGFLGLGWRDDVARILSGSDIFLLGSAFGEGSSLALDEAMRCGLACVVTDVGGHASRLGDAGFLLPPRQPAALREAIQQLARDRRLRDSMGLAARRRAAASDANDDSVRRLQHLRLSAGQSR